MNQSTALPRWVHAVPVVGCLLSAVVLATLASYFQGQNFWGNWSESKEFRNPSYTEAVDAMELFRTRSNTWSNIAYVFVGLYCIAFGLYDRISNKSISNYLVGTPAISLLFGLACCYLGFSSGLFHASLTKFGQQLDVGSMYAPLLCCIAINVGRYLAKEVKFVGGIRLAIWPFLVISVLLLSYLLYLYKWSMSAVHVLALHILVIGVFAVVDQFPQRGASAQIQLKRCWLLVASLSLVLGIYFRQIDVAGRFGGPDWLLQGHAIWHLLTSGSLGAMYLYYRSELILDSPGSRTQGSQS